MQPTPFRPSALQRYARMKYGSVIPDLAPESSRFSLWDRVFRRRVPVLRQLSTTECGAACLAMVLGYFGRITHVAEVRDRIGIGRDGATARALAQAGREYGLRTRAYSVEPHQIEKLPLPAVVHWEFNHFIVVERWSPNRIEIVDPALGRRTLTPAEFDLGFTGVALSFEPGPHFERSAAHTGKESRSAWGLYLRGALQIPRVPAALGKVLTGSLFLQFVGLALPLFTALLIDRILPTGGRSILPAIGLGIVLVLAAQAGLVFGRAGALTRLQASLDARLMLDFFEHLLSLPYGFFLQRTSGDLLMRLGSNAVIRDLLSGQLVAVFLDGVLVTFYLAVLLWRDPATAALALGIGLLHAVLLLAGRRRMKALVQNELAAQAESQGYLVEALKGIATLKVSGAESQALERWSNLFYRHLNVSLQRRAASIRIETVLGALRTFAPLALLWLGAARVLDGTLSLGMMLGLNTLAVAFLSPLASLISAAWQFQLAGAHLERIADVVETAPEVYGRSRRDPGPLKGGIELRDVCFRFAPDAPPTLENVSLRIEPGMKVAIVGRSGSGKSTLAALMLGFHRPESGEILFDGIPLGELDVREVRQQFGVVLQQPFVFSGSLRENLSLHDPETPLEKIEAAVRTAGLAEDIARLPMGYETLLSEGGAGFSGGQVQRLALARALVHDPVVLLLDEATSHLDTTTEAEVEANLRTLATTRIVIAHRLSTICSADLIVVLDRGRIVERGTHAELVALGGNYAALVHGN